MTDFRTPPPPPRGLRIGVVSVLVAISLLLGLVVGVVLVRRQMAREADSAAPAPVPALTVAGAQTPANPAPVPTAPVDPASLAARQTVLAGQVAALEARAAALVATGDAAGARAGRAEALLTVIAARRALDRGLGLGALDTQLTQRFAATSPRAVAIVRMVARQPVTLEDLRQGLDAIGPAAAAGVSDGWWPTVRREMANLVVLHRAGTPSPRPVDHLARARRLLAADQVEAARAEVLLLPGAADAANWLIAARRYALARRALDTLENAALAGPAPPPPTPAATSVLLP